MLKWARISQVDLPRAKGNRETMAFEVRFQKFLLNDDIVKGISDE
jgi:hypothetical protein